MGEFAGFASDTRRYICAVLDCVCERGLWRTHWLKLCASPGIADRLFANIAAQRELRVRLLRFWRERSGDGEFMPLVLTTCFDLGMAAIDGFGPARFLAERLYGGEVRPLVPSVFAAAAIDVCLRPARFGFFPGETGVGTPAEAALAG